MTSLLIVTKNLDIANFVKLQSLNYSSIVKVAENENECYDFPADVPFSAVFIDCDTFDEKNLNETLQKLSKRFLKYNVYLFSGNKNDINHDVVPSRFVFLKDIYNISEVFDNLFSDLKFYNEKLLTSLRTCNILDNYDMFAGKRLMAVYPNTTYRAEHEVFSSLPLDLLPANSILFSDISAVYVFIDASSNLLNRICHNVIIGLHNANIDGFAVFTDVIRDFTTACKLFADVNAYAIKLKIEKNEREIIYYNDELRLLKPYGNVVKKAQVIGLKLRSEKSEAAFASAISDFFTNAQIENFSTVNLQFLCCEIIRCAFDDDVLYNNLFSVFKCKNVKMVKELLGNIFASEKIVGGDLSVCSNERIIRQICDIIETEYANDLFLERVAEQIYLSPTYVSRIFKKSTGMNFVKYLSNFRLKKAAILLVETEYPINEVSKMVGFLDVSYFCSCFKKKYGMTAIEYRREHLLNEVEV